MMAGLAISFVSQNTDILWMMARYPRHSAMEAIVAKNETTSKKVASTASKLLSDPKTSAKVKSVAASALTQAPSRKSGRK